ncbi:uncharacterized protein LOC141843677 [Curcuma longa]|uniref:uncharacterized protein LOC141843677 n=1 Tax=Curcuma longa TaxID=136217 RepID=UPI003D9F31AC
MDIADDHKWMNYLSFAFLTYNYGAAVYRSKHDFYAVTFIMTSYLDLLLLFWCLRKFETSAEENRRRLRAAVWVMGTLLTVMFSVNVAAVMPWPVSMAVYGMAAVTGVGGFWAFFIRQQSVRDN